MTKSFSLDPALFREVERTKGRTSTSERVNALLRAGLEAERERHLYSEAAAFFADKESDEALHDAFHQAGIQSMTRE